MIYDIIKKTSNEVKNNRKPQDVFLQVVEEVGELSKEMRIKHDKGYYKKDAGPDGIIGEGCDILISLIDLLILEGYDEQCIIDNINKKCNKWKSKA